MQKTAFGAARFPYGIKPGTGRRRSITKIMLVMRLTAFLLTVAFLQVHASGAAQSVTLSGKDISLKQVFSAIKQQTGYVVFYNRDMLKDAKPVSLTVYQMPLQDVLKIVFTDQPVNYSIENKTIVLSLRPDVPSTQLVQAPDVNVTGRITNAQGDVLPGVSIRVKGTGRGTVSNIGGVFSLMVNEGEELEITFMGYAPLNLRLRGDVCLVVPSDRAASRQDTSRLVIAATNALQIVLQRSTSMLDEVQIIPYGTTSRRFATGSIGSVKGKDIAMQPVMNVMQALEGKVPGLNLTSISGNSASPVKVEIRGRNTLNPQLLSEPLYIIDGVPFSTLEVGLLGGGQVSAGPVQAGLPNTTGENPLLFMNPRDIESVDVLKDADATAIYGSRGANGVILITTKKNKPGPARFSLNINKGTISVQRYLDMMSTPEYLAMRREALMNDKLEWNVSNARDLLLWDTTSYTDWQRELLGTGSQLSIDARVTGGIAQTSYSIGANYHSQADLMNNGGRNNRASFLLSLSHSSLDQKFYFDARSTLAVTDVVAYQMGGLLNTAPNAPDIFLENGEINFAPWRGQWNTEFPFGDMKRPSESRSNTVMNSLSLRYEIFRGLTISTTAGYNFNQNKNAKFYPDAANDPFYPTLSSAFFGNSTNTSWTAEPQIQYTTFIGKGNLNVQLGASVQQVNTNGLTSIGQMFPHDGLIRSINNAAFSSLIEGVSAYKYNAAFGIINYRWDDKYVLNLTARRDGSSRFGPGKQFGNFGAVGLAWIATQEKWIRDFLPATVSFIKFRGSYGVTGRDGIGDYEYLSRWASIYMLSGSEKIFNYDGIPAFNIVRAVNQEFQWESTTKLEAAVSVALFKDRVNLEAVYYKNRSGNQLASIPTPVYTGFSGITANSDAVVENSGVEFMLNANVVQTKDWNVSVNFNISRNRNKLAAYPNLQYSPYASSFVVGKSLNMRYLLHYTGINPLTGLYSFEDRNKDGVVYTEGFTVPQDPADDRYVELDLTPRYFGGFGSQAGYKGFSLYAHFVFKKQLGQDPFLSMNVGQMKNYVLPGDVMENHWRNPGDIARYPRFSTIPPLVDLSMSDGAYTDASFLKLNTLSLTYDLPQKWTSRIKIQGCRIGVMTQNLFTITSYRGLDPEMMSLTMAAPIPRTITTNLSFNF